MCGNEVQYKEEENQFRLKQIMENTTNTIPPFAASSSTDPFSGPTGLYIDSTWFSWRASPCTASLLSASLADDRLTSLFLDMRRDLDVTYKRQDVCILQCYYHDNWLDVNYNKQYFKSWKNIFFPDCEIYIWNISGNISIIFLQKIQKTREY